MKLSLLSLVFMLFCNSIFANDAFEELLMKDSGVYLKQILPGAYKQVTIIEKRRRVGTNHSRYKINFVFIRSSSEISEFKEEEWCAIFNPLFEKLTSLYKDGRNLSSSHRNFMYSKHAKEGKNIPGIGFSLYEKKDGASEDDLVYFSQYDFLKVVDGKVIVMCEFIYIDPPVIPSS